MKHTVLLAMALWFVAVQAALGEAAKSTIEDQKSVALTVYNNGLGLVKDVRDLAIGTGTVELKFMDVASQIDATSVHIKSLTSPGSLSILEQNYEYDLLNPAKLLTKYVDQPVKLLFRNMYTGEEKVRDAVLLSTNEGQIYKIDNEIHINPVAQVILPRIPENLIAKPTLVWLLNNSRKEKQNVEASYLTNGITWKANYVAVIDKEDKKSDLTGWVTIENKSGATYNNASLKLVAGDVHRVTPPPMPPMAGRMRADMAMEAKAAPPPKPPPVAPNPPVPPAKPLAIPVAG